MALHPNNFNTSFHSMQKFSSDSSIINYVHSLPVIAPGKGEEFDFSISNDVAGVHISNSLDIFEIISDCRSGPFTLIDLELPTNSYMIACILKVLKERTVHLSSRWSTLLDLIWNLLDMI